VVLRAGEERRPCLLGEVSECCLVGWGGREGGREGEGGLQCLKPQAAVGVRNAHVLFMICPFFLLRAHIHPSALPPSLLFQVRASGPAAHEDSGLWDRRAAAALCDGHGVLLGQAVSGRGREGERGGREGGRDGGNGMSLGVASGAFDFLPVASHPSYPILPSLLTSPPLPPSLLFLENRRRRPLPSLMWEGSASATWLVMPLTSCGALFI